MDELIDAIADASPKFNQFLLEDYPKREIENAPQFTDRVWRDAVKMVGGAFTYIGYDILSPEERAAYEMAGKNRQVRTVSGPVSELLLVRYKFMHEGVIHENFFYVPHLKDRTLFIRGKRMSLVLGITECVFSRMIEKNRDGIMIRPIRLPIRFNRTDTFRLISDTSKFQSYEFITIGYLHNKLSSKRSLETTVLHYLLCKFGFTYVIQRFGYQPSDILFTDVVNQQDVADFDYFPAKKSTKRSPEMVYLKIRKELLNDPLVRKIAAAICYTLSHFDLQTVDELYDTDGSMFRILLGKIVSPAASTMSARAGADTHIASVDLFLDPTTRARFDQFIPGIGDDIYDLLIYVFIHIDSLMSNSSAQNLYEKRIDVSVGILVEAYAKAIYHRIYRSNQKTTLRRKEVASLLKTRPMAIDAAISSNKKDGSRNINPAPTIANDSWLSSCGIHKNRHDGSPKLRFDPSMAYAESIVAFTGKNIGRSGYINPFVQIDQVGGIVRTDYCDDIDSLQEFLPK